MSYLEAGKMFLVMKEREQNFLELINTNFPQYSQSTIYNFMRAALVFEEHPRIAQKVIDLPKTSVIELCKAPDEDLKELEENGILAGKNLDEIARMPVRDVRELARRLKTDKDKVVQEAVKLEIKHLEQENDLLKKQVKDLRALGSADSKLYKEEIKELDALNNEFFQKVLKIKFTEELYDDEEAKGFIARRLNDMSSAVNQLIERWEQFVRNEPE